MRFQPSAALTLLLATAAVSCGERPEFSSALEPVDPQCAMPSEPVELLNEDGAVLKVWSFPADNVLFRPVIPRDSALLAYRARIRADGADVRLPILYEPTVLTEAESEVWSDEAFNRELAYNGEVGSVAPISCLDALLFAHQAARFSQIEQPTEFIASVLRRELADMVELTVVFGASSEMFPPRSVYGFETVDEYQAEGWSFWYNLHNHTVQRDGASLALGVPVPSPKVVALKPARRAGEEMSLEAMRVTNGFYTFNASVEEMAPFRSR